MTQASPLTPSHGLQGFLTRSRTAPKAGWARCRKSSRFPRQGAAQGCSQDSETPQARRAGTRSPVPDGSWLSNGRAGSACAQAACAGCDWVEFLLFAVAVTVLCFAVVMSASSRLGAGPVAGARSR